MSLFLLFVRDIARHWSKIATFHTLIPYLLHSMRLVQSLSEGLDRFCVNWQLKRVSDRQTDRQTDRRTDGRTSSIAERLQRNAR